MVEMIGECPAVLALQSMIDRVAGTKSHVLILGESGTGKELVARSIHEKGPWKNQPFMAINCAAIPETLIESELFGHKRGSFTGAVQDKIGLFEAATGGTLFLDEIGEIPLAVQVKLLRALQDKTIRRVGGNESIKVDVRILSATNRDLEKAIKLGGFREDLFYRLNVLQLRTPALRDRGSDLKLLSDFFLGQFARAQAKKVSHFSPAAWAIMQAYSWPGNIRELQNVIERAVTLASERMIEPDALPEVMLAGLGKGGPAGPTPPAPSRDLILRYPDFKAGPIALESILIDVEKFYVDAALAFTGQKKTEAAKLIGISFRSLRYRLTKEE